MGSSLHRLARQAQLRLPNHSERKVRARDQYSLTALASPNAGLVIASNHPAPGRSLSKVINSLPLPVIFKALEIGIG